MKLTPAMFEQLMAYVAEVEREGWYYGPEKQFRKRHQKIIEWLKEQFREDVEGL